MTDLESLSPSARLVAKTLEHEGPLAYSEIVTAAPIADSSLDRALEELRATDHVVHRYRSDETENRVYATR